MRDLFAVLIEMNVALAAGVVLIAWVRGAVRHRFGSRAAYGLWWAIPAAICAVCLPRAGSPVAPTDAASSLGGGPLIESLLVLWGCGVVISVIMVIIAQVRFASLARRGLAGPAVTGVLVGRVVMPADSASRWTPDELAVIRAHERAHKDRGDLRINALVAIGRCVFWCNPLAHIGARWLRFDQELACDAAVMAQRPGHRRIYAEALLKATPVSPLALGCGWALARPSALEARLTALRSRSRSSSPVAAVVAASAIVVAGAVAWSLQPPTPVVLETRARILNIRLQPAVPPSPFARNAT